jgi:hypothetical protein
VRQAGGTEVPFERGFQPRVVSEREPEQQSGLPRGERGQDRAAGQGAEGLCPSDRRERGRPEALDPVHLQLGRDPAPQEELREPAVVDRPDRASDPKDVAADGVRWPVAAREPDGLSYGGRTTVPRDRAHVEDRGPPVELRRRVEAERALDDDVRRGDAGDDRALDPVLVHGPPPDGDQECSGERHQQSRHSRAGGVRGRDRLDERAQVAFDQPGALERRIVAGRAWRTTDRGRKQQGAAEHPRPRVRERADPSLGEQARPHGGRERRRDPRAHTVTSSRMFSSVASPIPLTSSSWSTEANGPFSVR